MTEQLEEERRLRKRAEEKVEEQLRELYVAREKKRRMAEQLAASDELLRRSLAELNRRAAEGEHFWGVVWRRGDSDAQDSEWFPADHGPGAETLYEVVANDPSVSAAALQKVITIKEKENMINHNAGTPQRASQATPPLSRSSCGR